MGSSLARLRELAGEAPATAAAIAVMASSSTLGAGSGAPPSQLLLGSLSIGAGYGLIVRTFGRVCRPQLHPLVSILMWIARAQTSRAAVARIFVQCLGATATTLTLIALMPPVGLEHRSC